jgi:hypothetical protein
MEAHSIRGLMNLLKALSAGRKALRKGEELENKALLKNWTAFSIAVVAAADAVYQFMAALGMTFGVTESSVDHWAIGGAALVFGASWVYSIIATSKTVGFKEAVSEAIDELSSNEDPPVPPSPAPVPTVQRVHPDAPPQLFAGPGRSGGGTVPADSAGGAPPKRGLDDSLIFGG